MIFMTQRGAASVARAAQSPVVLLVEWIVIDWRLSRKGRALWLVPGLEVQRGEREPVLILGVGIRDLCLRLLKLRLA
jgi:hypothetical protein